MNYTENYHLPQWVKEDRIMMDDFNAAMSSLENGLMGLDRKMDGGTDLTWNAILRTGWRMMEDHHELADPTEIYSRDGLTINPLSSEEMAASLSGATWQEGTGVILGKGPAVPDTVLRAGCTGFEIAGLHFLAAGRNVASYSFTAPLSGSVTGFTLYGYLLASAGEGYSGAADFLAEEKSGSAWRTVGQKAGIPVEHTLAAAGDNRFQRAVSVNVPIVRGREYRFTLTLTKGQTSTGTFGFVENRSGDSGVPDSSRFTVQRLLATSGSHSRSCSAGPSGGSRALVMAWYRTETGSAGISVSAGGQSLAPAGSGTAVWRDGEACQRACFQAKGGFYGNTAVHFQLSCGASDTLRLLSYAVMFL